MSGLTGFKVGGVDFSNIFIPYSSGNNAATGYTVNGRDLSSIFQGYTTGTRQTDITGHRITGGGDLNNFFLSMVSRVGTGGTITINGNYAIHKFDVSGTFTLLSNKTINVFMAAGGGSGGSITGSTSDRGTGGGGAGGYILTTSSVTASTVYTVNVGIGGTYPNNHGQNTTFNNLTAIGGACINITTFLGGSGPGANHYNGSTHYSGTINQGNTGGGGYDSGNDRTGSFGGGGGGGATTSGSDGSKFGGGNGGTGITISSSNLPGYNASTTFCGGGAGGYQDFGLNVILVNGIYSLGKGGSGGGGNGGYTRSYTTVVSPTVGQPNTGGGGGGGSYQLDGTSGGSGTVIITYVY
jgi:hypothetical protein